MGFSVCFMTGACPSLPTGNAVKIKKAIGIQHLDATRKKFNNSSITINCFAKLTVKLECQISLEISEVLARKSKLFSRRSRVCCLVKEGSLNRFYTEEIVRDSNQFQVALTQNTAELLGAWEKAGFPLK